MINHTNFAFVDVGDGYGLAINSVIASAYWLAPHDGGSGQLFTGEGHDLNACEADLARRLAIILKHNEAIRLQMYHLLCHNYLSCAAHRSTHLGLITQTPASLQPISDHPFKLPTRPEPYERPFASQNTEEYYLTPFLRRVFYRAFQEIKQR